MTSASSAEALGPSGRPIVIDVDDVSKCYPLYKEKATSHKERITKVRGDRFELLWAVNELSLQVEEGQVYGLIGHNGSGKSTLLRMMAGIQKPNKGSVDIRGRVSALLELGAGFHPDLTGRENVYLNASILGMRRADIDKVFDDIVEFAGGQIPEFIDTPVKIYSSGMFVRLGFSVAVHMKPEILLIDEVIAVGDEEFQRRCFEYLFKLRSEGITIVMVTHALPLVQNMCDRAAWLDHGHLQLDGPAPEVVHAYLAQVNRNEEERHEIVAHGPSTGEIEAIAGADGRPLRVDGIELIDAQGHVVQTVRSGEATRVRVHYQAKEPVTGAVFSLGVKHETGLQLARAAMPPGDTATRFEGSGYVDFDMPHLLLAPGEFSLDVDVHDSHNMVRFDHREDAIVLHVQPGEGRTEAIFDLQGTWSKPQPG
jgi:ABC-2 type transport system ATP-binding protein/lipopolysaccharide transport system ATP-binding protein